jgi:hypothetical protein
MDNQTSWLDKAYGFLEAMESSGNRIAAFRNNELRKLDGMLVEYSMNRQRPETVSPFMTGPGPSMQQHPLVFPEGYHSTASLLNPEDAMPPPYSGISDEGSGFGDDLTAEQILAITESMDLGSAGWLSFTTLDNYQMVDPNI